MEVGVPAGIKNQEYRVAITPSGLPEFTRVDPVDLPEPVDVATKQQRLRLHVECDAGDLVIRQRGGALPASGQVEVGEQHRMPRPGHLQTIASNTLEIERAVLDADLVIGAVLVPGAKAHTVISNDLVWRMKVAEAHGLECRELAEVLA